MLSGNADLAIKLGLDVKVELSDLVPALKLKNTGWVGDLNEVLHLDVHMAVFKLHG